eukprot:131095-Pelagomonas_calceolata.AAC.1
MITSASFPPFGHSPHRAKRGIMGYQLELLGVLGRSLFSELFYFFSPCTHEKQKCLAFRLAGKDLDLQHRGSRKANDEILKKSTALVNKRGA